MLPTKIRLRILLFIVILFGGLWFVWQPAYADDDSIYPIIDPSTISLGKQGLFIRNLPFKVKFVEINKLKPPYTVRYPSGIDITYRGSALEITFMNAKLEDEEPGVTPSSVFFEIVKPELKLWEGGEPEEITIWYYNPSTKIWQICATRYIPENQNNGQYGRLACFIMGNGIYVLGKMEIDNLYPTVGPSTINLGKQGLFISNPPTNVEFVEIKKIKPPLPNQYLFGIDFAYRGAALDITFRNARKSVVKPGATLSSVYFNVSTPEVRIWEEEGPEKIAIWYYNKSSKEWLMCPTRYIPEAQNNYKYDRLACFIMGNGIYVLGKMEFDPVFPLWFKLEGEELINRHRGHEYY